MKILLIQPSTKPLLGRRKIRGSIMPPLAMLGLASVVRERVEGSEVDVADYEANNGVTESLADYDIIGLTGTSAHMPHVVSLVKRIRHSSRATCIAIGGPHASFCDKELLQSYPEIDAVFPGEAEASFVEFVKRYRGRDSLPKVAGVATRFRSGNGLGPVVEDLDSLPHPAYDLVDIHKYQLATHRQDLPIPFASVMTARGCPYECSYCQTPRMFGSQVRFRSTNSVVDELRHLIGHYGIRGVVFWDDTFTIDRNRTIELCLGLGRLNVKWMCNTRVELVDPELLSYMKDGGCVTIFYGVESCHKDTLERLRRRSNLSKVRDCFRWTRETGIKTVGTLMLGAPGDDDRRIQRNVSFLKELEPDYVYISIFNVTPGAAEFEPAKLSREIEDKIDWSDAEQFDGPPFGLPTIEGNLNRYDLQKAQEYAYGQFYGPEHEREYE